MYVYIYINVMLHSLKPHWWILHENLRTVSRVFPLYISQSSLLCPPVITASNVWLNYLHWWAKNTRESILYTTLWRMHTWIVNLNDSHVIWDFISVRLSTLEFAGGNNGRESRRSSGSLATDPLLASSGPTALDAHTRLQDDGCCTISFTGGKGGGSKQGKRKTSIMFFVSKSRSKPV